MMQVKRISSTILFYYYTYHVFVAVLKQRGGFDVYSLHIISIDQLENDYRKNIISNLHFWELPLLPGAR